MKIRAFNSTEEYEEYREGGHGKPGHLYIVSSIACEGGVFHLLFEMKGKVPKKLLREVRCFAENLLVATEKAGGRHEDTDSV